MTPPNFGITCDLSSYQGNVDVDKASAELHANGVPWLYMRGTHENGAVADPAFVARAKAFEANGIHVSAYAFGVGGLSGVVQSDRLEAVWPLDGGSIERGHVVDFEWNRFGPSMSVGQCEDFAARDRTHSGGRWPGCYGHARFMAVPANAVLVHCPYIVPTYGTSYVLPPTWRTAGAVLWQASDGSSKWPVPPGCPRSFAGVGPCDIDLLQVRWPAFAERVLGIAQGGGGDDDMLDPVKDAATFKAMLDKVLGTPSEAVWESYTIGLGDATIEGREHRDNMGPWYEAGYKAGSVNASQEAAIAALKEQVAQLQGGGDGGDVAEHGHEGGTSGPVKRA